jgi:hypothetical protein
MVSGHQVRHKFLFVPEAPGPFQEKTYFLNSAPQSMDLGPPDVSTLPVLTLEVSLEEEWHTHTPRDNKPVGPQLFLDHLMKRFLGIWDQDG